MNLADNVLLVEGDGTTALEAAFALREAGYQTTVVPSLDAALWTIRHLGARVVISDIGRQSPPPPEVCRRLRAEGGRAVVILADAGYEPESALSAGALDVVRKPVRLPELVARVRRLADLMPSRPAAEHELRGPGGLSVRPGAHLASVRGRALQLTPREFSIIQLLLEERGTVLSSDEIASRLWGHETFGAHNFVEAHVSRLRAKLRAGGAAGVIETVRGVGYVVR